jgi:hypothetical protein
MVVRWHTANLHGFVCVDQRGQGYAVWLSKQRQVSEQGTRMSGAA